MDGRTFSRGWPDLFKNKPGLFRMEYSLQVQDGFTESSLKYIIPVVLSPPPFHQL